MRFESSVGEVGPKITMEFETLEELHSFRNLLRCNGTGPESFVNCVGRGYMDFDRLATKQACLDVMLGFSRLMYRDPTAEFEAAVDRLPDTEIPTREVEEEEL